MNLTEYLPSKVMNGDKAEIIIGIDPDCEKSGVATLRRYDRRVEVDAVEFPALIKYLLDTKRKCLQNDIPFIVVVEASWKITCNWHIKGMQMSNARASAMGRQVGRNHETGRKIVEMCKALDIPVKDVLPLKKLWGADGKQKISHTELAYFVDTLPKRTNSEERDATLLAWQEAGFPVRIKAPAKKGSRKVS